MCLVWINVLRIFILRSFSSIEASICEIFTIENCHFFALIFAFVERLEKLSAKTACDVHIGLVKKSGKFKTVFFESTWCRNYGGLSALNLERTSNFYICLHKLQAVVITLLFNFLEELHHSRTDFNNITFLALYCVHRSNTRILAN